eukprot:8360152-Prorocentrum_lima.AAC.1
MEALMEAVAVLATFFSLRTYEVVVFGGMASFVLLDCMPCTLSAWFFKAVRIKRILAITMEMLS